MWADTRCSAAAVVVCLLLLAVPRVSVAQEASFSSNRWTQPEAKAAAAPGAPIPRVGYRRVAANERLELWVRAVDLALLVVDARVGATWSTSTQPADESGLNENWRALARSALTIEYIDERELTATESLVGSEVTVTAVPGGFDAQVRFAASGIRLRLETRLGPDGLTVRLPAEAVEEPSFRLANILVYPFLGAVREDRVAGYAFIPDGSGALVRFRKVDAPGSDAQYLGQIYGPDAAIDVVPTPDGLTREAEPARLPVFGVAHEPGTVRAAAFVAAIEEGAEAAQVECAPSGPTIPFTRVAARFLYRKQYFQPTSRTLGGLNVWQGNRAGFDAEVRYYFLAGDEADYVGMARRYQRRLVERGLLTRQESGAVSGVPVALTIPGADLAPGFLRPRVVTATTTSQLAEMVEELVDRGGLAPLVLYEGYAAGGVYTRLPRRLPVERELGGDRGLAAAAARLRALGVPLALVTNYTLAAEGAGGYTVRTDVARRANGLPLRQFYYYLAPASALSMAEADLPRLRALGVTGLGLTDNSFRLYTDFTGGADRSASVAAYRTLVQRLRDGGLSYYGLAPNEYLVGLADAVIGTPTESSRYLFATDTVPFYQIVLRGHVDYYSPSLNLSADPVESLLRAIDTGCLPAFTLTAEQPRVLAETAFEFVTTSWYPAWRDRVLEMSAQAARALSAVRGVGIARRSVPVPGVARTTYDNGTVIVVNYGPRVYADGEGVVPPRAFAVRPGGR